jgi:hypothetical protein
MIEKERIFKITKKRTSFFLIFVLMFVVTEIGRRVYRPYIYANDIFDFWIADTIGNLTGTIAIVFFDFAVVNPTYKAGRTFLAVITIGLIVYEFVQYFSPRSVLDWRDIIATLIGGAISLCIYELLCRQHKEEIFSQQRAAYRLTSLSRDDEKTE